MEPKSCVWQLHKEFNPQKFRTLVQDLEWAQHSLSSNITASRHVQNRLSIMAHKHPPLGWELVEKIWLLPKSSSLISMQSPLFPPPPAGKELSILKNSQIHSSARLQPLCLLSSTKVSRGVRDKSSTWELQILLKILPTLQLTLKVWNLLDVNLA